MMKIRESPTQIECEERSQDFLERPPPVANHSLQIFYAGPLPPPGQVPSDSATRFKFQILSMLRYLKNSSKDKNHNVLVQFWAPVTAADGRCYLSTSASPSAFVHCTAKYQDHSCPHKKLWQYKKLCQRYVFYLDIHMEKKEDACLIRRVFVQKLPELLPHPKTFSACTEYPQLDRAMEHNVHAVLALPLLDGSTLDCLGVFEIVFPSDYTYSSNYRPFTDCLLDTIEAFNFKSSVDYSHFYGEASDNSFPNVQTFGEALKNALDEIYNVLDVACYTFDLPLAQIWLPCTSSILRVMYEAIVSPSYSFASDFAWANKMVALQKGQGVAGRAYSARDSCFCTDTSEMDLVEHPLAQYAWACMLPTCFAICVRSNWTGDRDYVLEFFLPHVDGKPWIFLQPLLATLKLHLKSFNIDSQVIQHSFINYIIDNPVQTRAQRDLDTSVSDSTMQESSTPSVKKPPRKYKESTDIGSEVECVTIKATFNGVRARFLLSLPATLEELMTKLASRFGLAGESFSVNYFYADGDVICITHNKELQYYISSCDSETCVRILVLLD